MEIVKSRYGLERSIERIDIGRIRIMGESQFIRKSTNKQGDVSLFDFEGGPCYTLGGKVFFEKMNWRVRGIEPRDSGFKDLYEVILYVDPLYY
jgi:hypothetical protein